MESTIVVIEDEPNLLDVLRYNLETAGYNVRTAGSGETGLKEIRRDPKPDMIVLDLMLPDMDGVEVCRRIRSWEETQSIPVLMLTAKSEEIDRVVGFEVGADDYMVKPFSVRELLLRIKAVIRRTKGEPAKKEHATLQFGVLTIDVPAHKLWVDEREVVLTALEFKLLLVFLQRKGRVQTRDVLLSDVWGINADVTSRTVDTHVKRLREKLGPGGVYIETVRGVGYRFLSNLDEKPE